MKVAVIGGGVAGLVAARHLSETNNGFSFVLFEQTGNLGGTWAYSDQKGIDHNGLPIHSSMYKSLRTNLPKEAMMFPDFPHKKNAASYPPWHYILNYLNNYADHFNIRRYVKFHHHVRNVCRYGSKWIVDVIDLPKGRENRYIFDAVIVCNGHNSAPRYPFIKGIENFKGRQVHSHEYRESNEFANEKVLVIGAGPSGLDISLEISTVTVKVSLSHHCDYVDKINFPSNVHIKPDVVKILNDGKILFSDGSISDVDVIAYCTGYKYTYPFLDESCGVLVEDNYISPLYNHVININEPTMAFIAVIKHTPTFYVADLQVQMFLASLRRPVLLPHKKQMLNELKMEIDRKISKGIRQCDFHTIGHENEKYISQLARIAGVPTIPSIILKIYFHGYEKIFGDFRNFRNYQYEVIDKENFKIIDLRGNVESCRRKLSITPATGDNWLHSEQL